VKYFSQLEGLYQLTQLTFLVGRACGGLQTTKAHVCRAIVRMAYISKRTSHERNSARIGQR
jgi:hypothetical protein